MRNEKQDEGKASITLLGRGSYHPRQYWATVSFSALSRGWGSSKADCCQQCRTLRTLTPGSIKGQLLIKTLGERHVGGIRKCMTFENLRVTLERIPVKSEGGNTGQMSAAVDTRR